MNKYYARICWNSHGWVFPSGEAKELEKKSYVAEAGFGSEEWLFNFAWLIDGYHYAFLQPVSRAFEKVTGKRMEVLLYTINPKRDRVYVGRIKPCEVLTRTQAEGALKHYKKSGWLRSMKAQIAAVNGHSKELGKPAFSQFNVRFRPADVDFYQPPRIAPANDFVTNLKRYTLTEADQRVIDRQWGRKGMMIAPTVQTITRSGQPGVTYDPVEKALQGELFELLRARFGKGKVVLEANFVDITVTDGTRKILVETKSDAVARLAIRKALGQVLEYAYFHPDSKNGDAELVIVAPGPMTPDVASYLDLLRAKFGIPVEYCRFSLGDKLPSEFDVGPVHGA